MITVLSYVILIHTQFTVFVSLTSHENELTSLNCAHKQMSNFLLKQSIALTLFSADKTFNDWQQQ